MKFPFVLRSTLEKSERENDQLRAALEKAQKNDHRNPKTGRFVKG